MKEAIGIRVMTEGDIAACRQLWQRCEGVVVRDWEGARELSRFLAHNPALSWVAVRDGAVIGSVLCGSDGWRGCLYHLAVDPACRHDGVATSLVARAMLRLEELGLPRVHAMVSKGNPGGALFFLDQGWTQRNDIELFSADLSRIHTTPAP